MDESSTAAPLVASYFVNDTTTMEPFNETVFPDNTTANNTLNCPVYGDSGQQLLDAFNFWLEGVTKAAIACAGLIANIVSAIILMK